MHQLARYCVFICWNTGICYVTSRFTRFKLSNRIPVGYLARGRARKIFIIFLVCFLVASSFLFSFLFLFPKASLSFFLSSFHFFFSYFPSLFLFLIPSPFLYFLLLFSPFLYLEYFLFFWSLFCFPSLSLSLSLSLSCLFLGFFQHSQAGRAGCGKINIGHYLVYRLFSIASTAWNIKRESRKDRKRNPTRVRGKHAPENLSWKKRRKSIYNGNANQQHQKQSPETLSKNDEEELQNLIKITHALNPSSWMRLRERCTSFSESFH